MRAYKIFNPNFTCRGFQFEVGGRYKIDSKPELCANGFHACVRPAKCFEYYSFDSNNIVCEVELHGEVVGSEEDKVCTNDIEILKQLTWEDVLKICNNGINNVGHSNTGNRNTGFLNTNEPKVRIFNLETDVERDEINFPGYFYFDFKEWVWLSQMTKEEIDANPSAKTCDGFLREISYQEAWKKSFENASQSEIELTQKLPNFDAQLFFEITGIDYFLKKS